MTKTSQKRVAMVLATALLSCACASIPRLPDEDAILEPQGEYRIGSGDALSVKLFYTAELNEDVVVRPDGRISLQLVGDVIVAGRTADAVFAAGGSLDTAAMSSVILIRKGKASARSTAWT